MPVCKLRSAHPNASNRQAQFGILSITDSLKSRGVRSAAFGFDNKRSLGRKPPCGECTARGTMDQKCRHRQEQRDGKQARVDGRYARYGDEAAAQRWTTSRTRDGSVSGLAVDSRSAGMTRKVPHGLGPFPCAHKAVDDFPPMSRLSCILLSYCLLSRPVRLACPLHSTASSVNI